MNTRLARSIAAAMVALAWLMTSVSFADDVHHDAHPGHKIFRPAEIQWTAAPNSLLPGAQMAILEGDPSKAEPFAMRLRFPPGFKVMPHTHTQPERITVNAGTLNIGFGPTFDESKTQALPVGTFGTWAPGVQHYAWFGDETILQLNSIGPWQVIYVNPADDPRKAPRNAK